jgi:hypothetical protein
MMGEDQALSETCEEQSLEINSIVERLSLSTLPEVSSPLEVLKKSVVQQELKLAIGGLETWRLMKWPRITEDDPEENHKSAQNLLKKSNSASFKLSQWNGRSIQNESKLNYIRTLPGDIITVQELWQHSKEITNIGEILEVTERQDKKRGGGSVTISLLNEIRVIDRIQLNQDSHIIKIKQQNTYYWLANIYLNKGTFGKIQKLFGKLKTIIPPNEWSIICCIGDFNIDMTKKSPEKELLTKFSKLMGLKIVLPSTATRGDAILDFIITGNRIRVQEDSILESLSDHKAITWNLQVETNQKKKPIKIPSKKTADEISLALINNEQIQEANSFLNELGVMTKERKRDMVKIIKFKTKRDDDLIQKLLDLQDPEDITRTINEHWKGFWRETEATRYSEGSAEAYKRLKSVLKYHLFEKRDGAIINCIQNEDGTIEDQPDQVNEQLLKTLEEIQVDNRWKWIEQKEFPQLAQLKQEKVEDIMSQLASNKAIAYDGLSNILFSDKKPEEFDRNDDRPKEKSNLEKTAEKLKDLWEIPLHAIEELEDTWNTRLVPLNKVFPNIPTRKEMRPIAVQSPLVKLLEARFLPKL